MRQELTERCQAFIENRDILKKTFRMENSNLYPVCANIFCARGVQADADTLLQCRDLLRAKTSFFSNFRGTVRLSVISLLAAASDPQERLGRMLTNYDVLKKFFWRSEYLALVAVLMTEMPENCPVEETALRGKELYDRMNQEHPFLTSLEDSVFSVLLAYSDKSDDLLIAEMEDCYQRLKADFHSSNDVQASSHVLALAPGATLEKTARVLALFQGLRDRGVKYGKYGELPVLAALSTLSMPVESAVDDTLEIDAFLAKQKGYGFFGFSRETRAMHAAMLTADAETPNLISQAAVMNSALATIAAQQAATCVAVATSTNY